MEHGIRITNRSRLNALRAAAAMSRCEATTQMIDRELERRDQEDLRNADSAHHAKMADSYVTEEEADAY